MSANDTQSEFDENENRLLREAEMLAATPYIIQDFHESINEKIIENSAETQEIVDINPLLTFFAHNNIDTTWSGGGEKEGDKVTNMPRIMFPHLTDLERVLRLFETLARKIEDEDIVQAIHNPVGEFTTIFEGEMILHGERRGAKIRGGRLVGLDHSWSVEIDSLEYEHWESALRKFNRKVPDSQPSVERMWRFTVYMPVGHAERLSRAAKAIN